MDILGLGVLIIGESGIGKSECALDLIVRGHRLVADDTVEVRRRAETILIGTCPELTRHHMELRGLGVINVRDLFGVAVDALVEARRARRAARALGSRRANTSGSGSTTTFYEILGLRVPLIRMPVAPGRNLAILVEVAARNQLLRARGHPRGARARRRGSTQHARDRAGAPDEPATTTRTTSSRRDER